MQAPLSSQLPTTATASGLGDARSLDALRQRATQDPKAVVREAARQFEAMFTEQLLKSMRESAQSAGLMDNEATKLGTEMLDGQWASKLAGRPGGLADVIARQMERQMGSSDGAPTSFRPLERPAAGVSELSGAAEAAGGLAAPVPQAATAPASVGATAAAQGSPQAVQFLRDHQAAAEAAEASSGIPSEFMLAQAAHETGWGKHPIRNADGSASNNLFGIKAGANWNGPTTDVVTTEVINGEARKVVQRFRSYASPAESFADYARMLKTNPRYANVAQQAAQTQDPVAFAQGLQRAGYATDPAYADKLSRVINTTLRLQRGLQA